MTTTTDIIPPLDVILRDLERIPFPGSFVRAWIFKAKTSELSEIMKANGYRAWKAAGFTYEPVPEPEPGQIKINRFLGTCHDCGEIVPAGEGRLDGRDGSGRYIVKHLEGQCPSTAERELAEVLATLTHGVRYALPCIDGRNDFDHVLVASDGKSIKRFVGGSGRWATESVERQLIWARALAGLTPEALDFAAVLFGKTVGICCDCGRPLEKEDSRAAGRGPDCAKKRGEA